MINKDFNKICDCRDVKEVRDYLIFVKIILCYQGEKIKFLYKELIGSKLNILNY